MAIGISVDEVHRARKADIGYMRNVFPLLDLGWRRDDCARYLEEQGLTAFGKSSCLGFHDDAFWARLKTDSPEEWADAVDFDRAIRHGSAKANADGHLLRGQFYLHRQRGPRPDRPALPEDPGDGPPGCRPWICPRPDRPPSRARRHHRRSARSCQSGRAGGVE
jgi:hypothetical protein